MTLTQTSPMLWRLTSIFGVIALLCSTDRFGLVWSASIWALWLLVLLGRPTTRIAGTVFVAISAYATVAWLAAAYGNHYFPPFPTLVEIERVTLLDLRCVIAAYLAVEIVIGTTRLSSAIADGARRCRIAIISIADRPWARAVVLLPLLVIGTLDWFAVVRIGLGSVLGGSRREYSKSLLLATDHNVQVVAIALTIVAVIWAVFCGRRLPVLITLTLCWLPFVLVGSRKELLLVAAATGVVIATSAARRLMLVLGALVAFMFLQPVLSSGDIYDSLHEFILPQYMHFSLESGFVSPDFAGSFLERALFLVPGPLRWEEPVNLAVAFYQSGATEVGVGASPFAEAAMITPAVAPEVLFAGLFTGIVLLVVFAAKRFWFVSLVGFAQLLILGRSDTFIALFFVLYVGLALHLLVAAVRLRASSVVRPVPRTAYAPLPE